MGPVVLEVVALEVGIAASLFPIVPAIMLLLTPRPRATGVLTVIGAVLVAQGLEGLSSTDGRGPLPLGRSW